MKTIKFICIGLAISVMFFTACTNEQDESADTGTTYEDQEFNEENNEFATWDQDQDQNLTSEEFGRAVNEDRANTNTELDTNTFRDDIYSRTDFNRDEQLDEEEFSYLIRWLKDDDIPITFGVWDKNNNNVIERNEFNEEWATSNRFSEFDKDGNKVIDVNEYILALYGSWDEDNDGRLDPNEFQKFTEWYN